MLALLTGGIILVAFVGQQDGWNPVLSIVLAVLLIWIVLFHSLTVEVDNRLVRVRFGPGPISKSVELKDITGVEKVRNRWYYGWGIRRIPRGWLFNVSGLDAVELTLASGKRYRLGTDRPDELYEALRRNIGQPGAPGRTTDG